MAGKSTYQDPEHAWYGLTLSSAIAALLTSEPNLEQAVRKGKDYISEAIDQGKDYQIGHGHGPVKHFFRWWD